MSRFDPRLCVDERVLARWALGCAVVMATALIGATALAAGVPGIPSLGFQRALARDLGIGPALVPHAAGGANPIADERALAAAVSETVGEAVGSVPSPRRVTEAPVAPATPNPGAATEVTPLAEVKVLPAVVPPAPPSPESEPEPQPLPEPEPKPEPQPLPEPEPPAPAPEPAPPVAPVSEPPLLAATFEHGLVGWSTAGVGEVTPRVTANIVREGDLSSVVRLTGTEDRSELILGGNGDGSTSGQIEFDEGAEYWYGFSFDIQQMVYGHPGAHNLIMQFKSDGEGSPNFGLQLWDVN
nr:hypothetical protein [Solirubrobacterales bacterium]